LAPASGNQSFGGLWTSHRPVLQCCLLSFPSTAPCLPYDLVSACSQFESPGPPLFDGGGSRCVPRRLHSSAAAGCRQGPQCAVSLPGQTVLLWQRFHLLQSLLLWQTRWPRFSVGKVSSACFRHLDHGPRRPPLPRCQPLRGGGECRHSSAGTVDLVARVRAGWLARAG
jgi:hypothetical protein